MSGPGASLREGRGRRTRLSFPAESRTGGVRVGRGRSNGGAREGSPVLPSESAQADSGERSRRSGGQGRPGSRTDETERFCNLRQTRPPSSGGTRKRHGGARGGGQRPSWLPERPRLPTRLSFPRNPAGLPRRTPPRLRRREGGSPRYRRTNRRDGLPERRAIRGTRRRRRIGGHSAGRARTLILRRVMAVETGRQTGLGPERGTRCPARGPLSGKAEAAAPVFRIPSFPSIPIP